MTLHEFSSTNRFVLENKWIVLANIWMTINEKFSPVLMKFDVIIKLSLTFVKFLDTHEFCVWAQDILTNGETLALLVFFFLPSPSSSS